MSTIDGQILDCNTYFARIFGYNREEILNCNIRAFYCTVSEWETFFTQLQDQGVTTVESRRQGKDRIVWVSDTAAMLTTLALSRGLSLTAPPINRKKRLYPNQRSCKNAGENISRCSNSNRFGTDFNVIKK